jgi:chromosome segregation ATPase
VTADRDRLQQAHQAMTEHAAELLESAQQARDQRDLLAQKLVTKPSEEALQKQVGKQQIEINTLKDKLQDMTSERDEIATELRAMTDHCEQQREKLQATTADRDRLQAEVANAQRLSADLRGEADFVRTQKTAQEHELRAANARLERELRDARIALDAEGETPATNRRAIADAHLVGAQTGRQAAFEAVERWVEVLDGVDSELAAAVLQALPGCIRRLAEREGVTL